MPVLLDAPSIGLRRERPFTLPRPGFAEGDEGFENLLHVGGFRAEEVLGERLWCGGLGEGAEDGFHGAGAGGEGFGPREFGGLGFGLLAGLRGAFGQSEGGAGFLGSGDGAELVIRAQPADEAARFLGGALGVQGHEARQDFLVAQRPRPAVGVRHGAVEVVVELLEDGDEARVVNQLFLGRERFVGAEFFEDVVKAGQGQAVLGLGALAVGVQPMTTLSPCETGKLWTYPIALTGLV